MRCTSILLLAIAVPFAAIACRKPVPQRVTRPGQPAIEHVAENDAGMNSAIDDSRKTISTFIDHLQHPHIGETSFSIKAPFREGAEIEHMWVSEPQFADGKFIGKIGNNPDTISRPKLGETVTIARDEISDWLIIQNGELRGGYSIRLLRERMNDADRREFDHSTTMKITDKVLPD